MLKSKNELFKIAIRLFSFYIVSILIFISFGYIIKNQKEIEEYKQLTSWNENQDKTEYINNYQSFIKQAQDNLKTKLLNEQSKVTTDIKSKIYSQKNLPDKASFVKWNLNNKTVQAYYEYTNLINFNANNSGKNINTINTQKEKDIVSVL